ncbi:MAG: ABC transporter substrate-binding protein, partial [SAR202 cluster bacterium]|nr:ABC transporter substrate-binding protein [SAR202 cluster bacterium]
SWEHPDPMTYVFRMRQGVLWPAIPPMSRADREVTAEDIRWFYEVMKAESISKTTFERVAKIEATDRYTVKLTLSEPEAELIYALVHHNLGIFSKECYDDKTACWGKKIISPGPFMLTVDEPRVRAVFDKNPEFWLKGLPYLDRKTVVTIADPNAQKSAFLSGQLDDITLLTPSEVASMERQMAGVQVDDIFGAPGQYHYDMQQDKPPFNDVRVRRAISMAIDRPALWQLAGEGHILPGMAMPWHLMGRELPITLDEAGQWYKYDPVRAKALLAEAGYPNGMKIRINSQWSSGVHADLNTGIADMLKRNLNIETEYRVMDGTAFNNLFYAGNWEGFYFTWCAIAGCAAMDATTYIIPFYSKSPQNTRHVTDPRWDELYLRWRASKTSKEFQDTLWEMNRYEMDNVLKVWIGSAGFFQVMPPWIDNAAMHATTWGSILNGPAWVTMIDPAKKK